MVFTEWHDQVPCFMQTTGIFFIRMTCFYEALDIYGNIVDKNRTTGHSKKSLFLIVAYDSTFQISCNISTLTSIYFVIYLFFSKKKDFSAKCQVWCHINYAYNGRGANWIVWFSNSSKEIKISNSNAKVLVNCSFPGGTENICKYMYFELWLEHIFYM